MEQWVTIYGWEHLLISSQGNIKSKARLCKRKDGGKGDTQYRSERVLYPCDKDGYLWLNLSKEGKRKFKSVHRLMIESFIRPLAENEEVNHINGNRKDNRLENLEIVSDKKEHSKRTWERLQQEWFQAGWDACLRSLEKKL